MSGAYIFDSRKFEMRLNKNGINTPSISVHNAETFKRSFTKYMENYYWVIVKRV